MWDIDQIITKARNITGTPSSSQLTDEEISDYVNTYYTFTMPFELKEQRNLSPINFLLRPNQATISLAGAFLTDQPMAYADGFPLIFYQDRDIFFQDWPQQYTSDPLGTGDGIIDDFAGTTQNFPIIPGTYMATDGTQLVFDAEEAPGILFQVILGVNTAVGTIDYVTGVFAFEFNNAPAVGVTVYDKYQPYQPARPQGVLWFNNKFTFRPIPDQVYAITMQGYIDQIQLDETAGDSPLQTEWGILIAYGASAEIFADRGDIQAYQNIYPIMKRYENVALGRTVQQYEASQSVPRF